MGLLATFAVSCGSESTEESANEEKEVAEVCTYTYDNSSTKLTWTAFKFTERAGVSGTFDVIQVTTAGASEDMYNALTGATFTIPVSSVNSENPDRDKKIQNHFFGTMTSTENISGVVKSIDESKATVEMTLNGVTKEYEGEVTVEGETVKLATTVDMDDFEAHASVDSLNTICYDLHTGEDGVSKLWSDVDVVVETTLVKECK